MGLNIRLLHNDKCVINGAVVTCRSQRTTLSVENFAQVIRAPDILDERDVRTPTERVYFAVQLMLLDPARQDQHRLHFNSFASQLIPVFENPEITKLLAETVELVDAENYYQALRRLKTVMKYERELMGSPQQPAIAGTAAG